MPAEPIPADALDDILRSIEEETCLPFLGAGVSAGSLAFPGLPLGRNLAEKMLEDLHRIGKNGLAIRDQGYLPEVATHYEFHRKRLGLTGFLRHHIPYQTVDPLPAHRALARLPLRLIITTNYDTLMERALDGARRRKRVVVQPRGGFKSQDENTQLFRNKDLVLYKMHGCLEQAPDQCVITEDDYFELLYYMPQKDLGVPTWISGHFAVSTLLFLGYSLEDIDFKVLYKLVEKFPASQRPQSYAIQLTSDGFRKQFWENKGVRIFNCDVQEAVDYIAVEFARRHGGQP